MVKKDDDYYRTYIGNRKKEELGGDDYFVDLVSKLPSRKYTIIDEASKVNLDIHNIYKDGHDTTSEST